jgi:hypothetical protein
MVRPAQIPPLRPARKSGAAVGMTLLCYNAKKEEQRMRDDIIEKLRSHLEEGIAQEKDVVYLLAQVRKILEKDSTARPVALWMYCHWALHVDLDRDRTTLDFLNKIDSYIQTNIAGFLTPSPPSSVSDEYHLFRDLLHCDSFRRELGEFLKKNSLPCELCDQANRWHAFMSAYYGVIDDGSLSVQSQRLSTIDKVTFSLDPRTTPENSLPALIWDIRLKDGRTLRANFSANTKLGFDACDMELLPAA